MIVDLPDLLGAGVVVHLQVGVILLAIQLELVHLGARKGARAAVETLLGVMGLVVTWHTESGELHAFFFDAFLILEILTVFKNHLGVKAETRFKWIDVLVHRDLSHFSKTLIKLDSFRLHIIIVFRHIYLLLIKRSSNFSCFLACPSSLDEVLFALVVYNMLKNIGSKSLGLIDNFLISLKVFKLVHLDYGIGKDVIQ